MYSTHVFMYHTMNATRMYVRAARKLRGSADRSAVLCLREKALEIYAASTYAETGAHT